MTVGEVLSYLKISAPMWSMIRKGTRNPSIKTIRRIEAAEIDCNISVPPGGHETRGEYHIGDQKKEMHQELMEIKKDLNALSKRVDHLIHRLK